METLSKIILFIGISLSVVVQAEARQRSPVILFQPEVDSPLGTPNENVPAEGRQFDFVVGDWNVDMTYSAPGKEPFRYRAKWHNHWVVNGYIIMQEWRGPFATGAELRYYDKNTGKWTGRNVYPGSNVPWHNTSAEFKDGKMVVTIEGNSDTRGPFLNRETYYDIMTDSFRMKSERSYDGGETWEKGLYEMICFREEF